MPSANPALIAFLDEIREEKVWGEALIRVEQAGFSIRHVADRSRASAELNSVSLAGLRQISIGLQDEANPQAKQGVTALGARRFRPLRSAPDLESGWIFLAKTPEELGRAVQELYPASIADWFAVRTGAPRVTNYREFTNRQTGMYRISQLLTDAQAAQLIRAGCASRFCLKRRLWSVEGLATDSAESKSEIPCLEPCALLLELARKAARIEQEENADVVIKRSDLESLIGAVNSMLAAGKSGSPGELERAGNIGSAINPRRLQLVLEKIGSKVQRADKLGKSGEE